jgi:hypothetical protein
MSVIAVIEGEWFTMIEGRRGGRLAVEVRGSGGGFSEGRF